MDNPGRACNGGGSVGRIGSGGVVRNAVNNNELRSRKKGSFNKNKGGFKDLDVYKDSYAAILIVFKKILPVIPKEERYDLYDQLRRSVKAIPRLIAEGHSKRHQNKGFQKYIDDAHAESNETIVSISQVRDLYAPQYLLELCDKLIDIYDKTSRGLYNLAASWENFHRRKQP